MVQLPAGATQSAQKVLDEVTDYYLNKEVTLNRYSPSAAPVLQGAVRIPVLHSRVVEDWADRPGEKQG